MEFIKYKIWLRRKLWLITIYLLMVAFLVWGGINTFIQRKSPPILFVLTVIMCICFGIYFYYQLEYKYKYV